MRSTAECSADQAPSLSNTGRRDCAILVGVSTRSERRRSPAALGLAGQAWRNLGAFRAAYTWLLRDLAAHFRRRLLAVVGLNLLGVAMQWTVVGAVLIFVGELTGEGGAFQIPLLDGLDLPVEASFGAVAGWSVVVLALVTGAALSTYQAEAIGFETARRYVERSGRKILEETLSARTSSRGGGDPPARRLQRVLARDQTMVLRALLVVQRSLRSILMVAVAAIVLALINPVLTAVVAAVATLFVGPYYFVNRRVVAAAAALEDRNAGARASVARLVDHATSREPNAEIRRVVPGTYPTDVAISERWSALREILLGRQRTVALMTGLLGTCLVAIVVAFGLIIARDEASWVAALTFLVALNLASGAFIQLAGEVTAANRFLPHVQEYIAFALAARTDGSAGAPETSGTRPMGALPSLRAAVPILKDSDLEITLSAGTRVLCIVPEATDRLNLESLLTRLTAGRREDGRRLRNAAFFFGDSRSLPPVAVRALLGDHGVGTLAMLGHEAEVDNLPNGGSTELTTEIQDRLSPGLRYTLGVLEGVDRELLVLGWSSFSRLPDDHRSRLLDVIGVRPVIFITSGAPRRQPLEVTHTVVVADGVVKGMGDAAWYGSLTSDVGHPTAVRRKEVSVKSGADVDDLDDEM